METLSVWQALIIALWISGVMSRSLLGGATTTLRFTPMMTGLVCGIVMGDVPNAMIVVAAIQLIYMGVFSPGGQMPSEPAIAAAVAVPVALLGDLDAEASIAIAVPVGLLGSYLYQFRFFLNTLVLKATDKYAAEANDKKLTFTIIIAPILIAFALFTPLMFVALYFGAPVIASIVNAGIPCPFCNRKWPCRHRYCRNCIRNRKKGIHCVLPAGLFPECNAVIPEHPDDYLCDSRYGDCCNLRACTEQPERIRRVRT